VTRRWGGRVGTSPDDEMPRPLVVAAENEYDCVSGGRGTVACMRDGALGAWDETRQGQGLRRVA
jgi:hypothetical protein